MKRVLVIEDNADTSLMLVCALRGFGYLASSVARREFAIQAVIVEAPHTVFVDLFMAGDSIDTFCAQMRSIRPNVKVVLMSAANSAAVAEVSFRNDISFLLKPFEPKAMCAFVDNVLESGDYVAVP